MRKILLLAAAWALASCGPAFAEGACKLSRVASLPTTLDTQGGVTIPVSAGGQPLIFGVHTQSSISVLSQAVVDKLALSRYTADWMTMTYGGEKLNHYVILKDLQIGTLPIKDAQLYTAPAAVMPFHLSAILGQDFLGKFDLDFDFAHAALNLFAREHCENQVIYWTKGPAAMVPFSHDYGGRFFIMVELDGKPVEAYLDTGYSRSVLTLGASERLFGLTKTSPGVTPVGGVTSDDEAYRYAFKSLTFAGAAVNNPDITLLPGNGDSLSIGMDVLSRLHVYVDYSDKSIFLTGASAH